MNSSVRSFAAVLAFAITSVFTSGALAATITPLTPAGGLGRLEFKHQKMNQAGDFVAVSNTRVYVGNAKEGTLDLVLTNDEVNFVLGETTTIQGTPNVTYIYHDVFQTRLALNNAGDFVLASNNQLWKGNTRTKTIQQIADGGRFTNFQTVLINDAGYFLAVANEKIFGGQTSSSEAVLLLNEAVGYFSTLNLYSSTNRVEGYSGEQRVALNTNGRFMALTGSAVYHGDINTAETKVLLEERWGGFRHVNLADDDTFSLVSDNDIYVGNIAD